MVKLDTQLYVSGALKGTVMSYMRQSATWERSVSVVVERLKQKLTIQQKHIIEPEKAGDTCALKNPWRYLGKLE